MKILKYRGVFNRFPGRKQPAAQAEAPEAPRVVEKKIKTKALLIGIQRVREEAEVHSPGLKSPDGRSKWAKLRKQNTRNYLKGPHRDVKAMRELLINVYHYEPEDITILIDDDVSSHPQPTRVNILKAIEELIKDAKEHDRFFFHYSGHSDQEDTDDIEEEDRKNEFIIACDGTRIKDDELRANLAMPLPEGSSLIAVFDSCHSGSLLDLKHFRCNRVYVPWINKGNRRTNSLWNGNKRMYAQISARGAPVARFNKQVFTWARTSIDGVLAASREDSGVACAGSLPSRHKPTLSIITDVPSSPTPWLDSPGAREKQVMSPVAMYCTGYCRDDDLFTYENAVKADVISISSSKDSQLTWEDANGTHSMTQVLVRLLMKNPHPTYQDLMTLVSHEIHAFYVDLHSRAKMYKKKVQVVNKAKMLIGKKIRPGDPVEMDNFQNPQLSTDRPMDMSRHFYP
ncbi:hypothetical protein BDN70DRAFT_883915 [Pholiota conissans]|uniref:Peptidase C14 caspase domain-containing protein n=1 Tax=Pholiota conissans TaxID=109636 RepID=A0A9P6CQ04_9AGAR|nr:hypothetical protein BDN70DRAFT_883915 [Pholiota conissans]